MGCDRAPLQAPKYGINETAYARASALRGYVEPMLINNVFYDPASNQYRYNFKRDLTPGGTLLLPITLLESELLTLCEALDIQISELQRQLVEQEAQYKAVCAHGEDILYKPGPTTDRGVTNPGKPRFQYGDVVYLTESAETVGRLESYRIDGIRWEPSMNQWLYTFNIKKRPGRSTTVGDSDDLGRSMVLYYSESSLCTVCEALPLTVSFMRRAVQLAVRRRESLCQATKG